MQFVIAVLAPLGRLFGEAEAAFLGATPISSGKRKGKGSTSNQIISRAGQIGAVVRFVRFQSYKLITEGRCPNGFLRLQTVFELGRSPRVLQSCKCLRLPPK